MTIVNELNKLAKKITGTNPKATTDKKALDYIADYYAEEDLKPTTNAQAIKNITDNYNGGEITPKNYVIDITKETIEDPTQSTYDIIIANEDNVNVINQYIEELSTNLKTESKIFVHTNSSDIELHITNVTDDRLYNGFMVQNSSLTETNIYNGNFSIYDGSIEYYITYSSE